MDNTQGADLGPSKADTAGPLRPTNEPPAPIDGAGDSSLGGAPEQASATPSPKHALEIAPGKALTTRRGTLSEGAEVHVRDFAPLSGDEGAGRETVKRLVAKGYILDNTDGGEFSAKG